MSTEIARVRGTQDLFTLLRIEDNYMVEKKESVQSKAREYRPITRDHMELIEDQIIEYHTELREVALEMMLTPKLPGVREQDSLTPVAWLEQFPTPTEHLTLYYAASG